MSDSRSRPVRGSDLSTARTPAADALPRPRKRPVQARARFTVQAIYDAYVRIWRRDGPDALTMRALADESGFAIGTIYEYFPNKAALHSGYVRHVMDGLRARIREQIVEVTPQLAAWSATAETTAAALQGVLRSASAVGRHDFLYAEQAVMALQVLIDQLDALKALPAIERSLLRERMDALLASLANPERYDASRTRYFFDQIAKSLP